MKKIAFRITYFTRLLIRKVCKITVSTFFLLKRLLLDLLVNVEHSVRVEDGLEVILLSVAIDM